MTWRIGSLFSGYGGLDMAVMAAVGGGQVVWHSDIKPASITLLDHHYPDVPNLGDMTLIDYSAVAPIDVLAASWPCQPHSVAGKKLGSLDERALWPQVARAIAETRPKMFFGENVGRITTNGELRRVIRSLAELGYVGAWRCLRASDVGACHPRSRCFVVAFEASSYADGARSQGRRRLHSAPREMQTTSHCGLALAEYEPAITHWGRILGRPAPPAVVQGCGYLLAPEFVEWMMGLPAGWVTEVPGLTRNQMLSLLGDGVCPPQAAAAFSSLIEHLGMSELSEAA